MCNENNNLLCVDIDIKNGKNGLEYLNKYNNNFLNDMINYTLCEKTKSGGYHIYFTYKHSNKEIEDKIKIMSKKLLKEGVDIILKNNYVKCYPSINYKPLNDLEINELPEDLFYYLFNNISNETIIKENKENKNINYDINNDGEYNIYSDNQLIEMLDKLDNEYLENYNKWLIITTILKTEEKKYIWDNWSKKSNKYNYDNNIKIWNGIKNKFNLDYINYKTNTKPFYKYKIYKPITDYKNIKISNINIQYLNKMTNKKNIFNHKSIIIKSPTGTGKTTIISEEMKKLLEENKKLRFLTITPRETLSEQHLSNFKDLNIKSYKDLKINEDIDIRLNNNYTICINSLYKLLFDFTDNDLSYLIVYLDEITSLLKYITQSETLINIKFIFNLFIRLIKNCHKIILTDATINDLSFLLINKYRNIEDTIYINNEFKNQENKNVYLINDEYEFLDKIKDHINNNDYFLYASDSKTIITDHFNNHNIDDNKFKLFTQESKHKINDELFNNKFLYYSPSIQYGVDFNNKNP
jgi:hypothetical protein